MRTAQTLVCTTFIMTSTLLVTSYGCTAEECPGGQPGAALDASENSGQDAGPSTDAAAQSDQGVSAPAAPHSTVQ